MKKIFIAAILLFFSINTTSAQESIEELILPDIEEHNGLYVNFAENVEVEEKVNGDVVVVGKDVSTKEYIDENFFGFGQTITIDKEIDGNAFIFGDKVVIEDDIDSDLYFVGNEIEIKGNIGGDLYALANNVLLKGSVDEDIYIAANQVFIEGIIVRGNISLNGKIVKLSPQIKVNPESNIKINMEETKSIEQYFDTEIPVSLEDIKKFDLNVQIEKDFSEIFSKTNLMLVVFSIVGNGIATWFIFRFFPRKSEEILRFMKKDFVLSNLWKGFLASIIFLFGSIILIVSVFGWQLLGVLFSLMLIIVTVSKYFYYYEIGNLIVSKVNENFAIPFINGLVGSTVIIIGFILLSTIPIVGPLIVVVSSLFLFFWSAGAVIQILQVKQTNE